MTNDQHTSQRVEQAIANDARTNELGVRIECTHRRVLVRGEVASQERRDAVLTVVREQLPGAEIVDHLRLSDATDPPRRTELVDPPQ
jgi:osmotically-inducible protein OsmY